MQSKKNKNTLLLFFQNLVDPYLSRDTQKLVLEYLGEGWKCIKSISLNYEDRLCNTGYHFCDTEFETNNGREIPFFKLSQSASLEDGDKILCALRSNKFIIKRWYSRLCEIWEENKNGRFLCLHVFDKPGKVVKLDEDTIAYYNYQVRKEGWFKKTEYIDYNFMETWKNINNKWICIDTHELTKFYKIRFPNLDDFYNMSSEQFDLMVNNKILLKNNTLVSLDYIYGYHDYEFYDDSLFPNKQIRKKNYYKQCIIIENKSHIFSIHLNQEMSSKGYNTNDLVRFIEISDNEFIFYRKFSWDYNGIYAF